MPVSPPFSWPRFSNSFAEPLRSVPRARPADAGRCHHSDCRSAGRAREHGTVRVLGLASASRGRVSEDGAGPFASDDQASMVTTVESAFHVLGHTAGTISPVGRRRFSPRRTVPFS